MAACARDTSSTVDGSCIPLAEPATGQAFTLADFVSEQAKRPLVIMSSSYSWPPFYAQVVMLVVVEVVVVYGTTCCCRCHCCHSDYAVARNCTCTLNF